MGGKKGGKKKDKIDKKSIQQTNSSSNNQKRGDNCSEGGSMYRRGKERNTAIGINMLKLHRSYRKIPNHEGRAHTCRMKNQSSEEGKVLFNIVVLGAVCCANTFENIDAECAPESITKVTVKGQTKEEQGVEGSSKGLEEGCSGARSGSILYRRRKQKGDCVFGGRDGNEMRVDDQ